MLTHFHSLRTRRAGAFTLIELVVVIGIIAILAGLTFPAIKALTKSNAQSQSVNLVRTMVTTARNIAISQHRVAGVVFFDETPVYSSPANGSQTAMQLCVADYNQRRRFTPDGASYLVTSSPESFPNDHDMLVLVAYSRERQYLPTGIRMATLNALGLNTADEQNNSNVAPARVILFDENGQLLIQRGLTTPRATEGPSTPGVYPFAYADWRLIQLTDSRLQSAADRLVLIETYTSSPGFFFYDGKDFRDWSDGIRGSTNEDPSADQRARWLRDHADVITVNAFTGNVVQHR